MFKKWNIVYPSKKKVSKDLKIIEKNIKPFYNKLPNISSFIYEAYYNEDSVRNSSDNKFIDIANNLFNKIDCYKSMEIFSKVLIL